MSRFTIAITGGIASGKSTVSRRFEALGIVVADADLVSKRLVEPGQVALAEIIDRFGQSMLNGDGLLDRAALRQQIFDDPTSRRDLEAILHPPIRDTLQRICYAAGSLYAMAAIPLLAEGDGRHGYPWLNRILVVDVPRDVQLARLLARDHVDRALARRMLDAQVDRPTRLAIADDVVENTGPLELLDVQVHALHVRYLQLAAAS